MNTYNADTYSMNYNQLVAEVKRLLNRTEKQGYFKRPFSTEKKNYELLDFYKIYANAVMKPFEGDNFKINSIKLTMFSADRNYYYKNMKEFFEMCDSLVDRAAGSLVRNVINDYNIKSYEETMKSVYSDVMGKLEKSHEIAREFKLKNALSIKILRDESVEPDADIVERRIYAGRKRIGMLNECLSWFTKRWEADHPLDVGSYVTCRYYNNGHEMVTQRKCGTITAMEGREVKVKTDGGKTITRPLSWVQRADDSCYSKSEEYKDFIECFERIRELDRMN